MEVWPFLKVSTCVTCHGAQLNTLLQYSAMYINKNRNYSPAPVAPSQNNYNLVTS